MFHVGQEVECIDNSQAWANRIPSGLVKGQIYTISAILPFPIEYGVKVSGRPGRFSHKRFRPLRKTDISIFTAMLNKTKETA
jgi:hypothetical protein